MSAIFIAANALYFVMYSTVVVGIAHPLLSWSVNLVYQQS